MKSNLLYNPLNFIKGNNRAGAIAEDLWASLKSDPVQKPMLLPTNDTKLRTIAKI